MVIARGPSDRGRWTALVLSTVVAIAAAVGVGLHVNENHVAGALDYRYTDTWDSIPTLEQWRLAVTKTIGPAPVLAPLALAQVAALVSLAAGRRRASAR